MQRIFNIRFKQSCRLLFSAVISEHFNKNRMIISALAAKIWYLIKCTVFIGPPCIYHCLQLPRPISNGLFAECKVLDNLRGLCGLSTRTCKWSSRTRTFLKTNNTGHKSFTHCNALQEDCAMGYFNFGQPPTCPQNQSKILGM